MVKNNKSPTLSQQSVKNVAKPQKGPCVKFADFADESNVHISTNDSKYAKESSASQSTEILSTSDLISAVGQIWDCASRSLAHLQPKASFGYSGTVCEKDNYSRNLFGTCGFHAINFIDSGCLHVDLNTSSYFSCIVQQSLTFMRATRRLHCKPINDHVIDDIFWQSGNDSSINHDIWLKEKSPMNVQTLYLMKRYEFLAQTTLWPQPPMFVSTEVKKIVEVFIPRDSNGHICPVPGNEESSSNAKTRNLGTGIDAPNLKHLSSTGIDEVLMLNKEAPCYLLAHNNLHKFPNKNFAANMSTALSLGLHLDAHVSTAAPVCTYEANQLNIEDDHLLEDEMTKCEKFNVQDEHQSERCSPVTNKPHPLLAKKEHAVSGALAGIFVSLCLHPVDTVKTLVQSCQPGQRSICYIGQSVLSERGLPGLYRGIASNVTSSAPISAIYTFTYESVKELLLPSLAKEYHSVAHCTAGASASIATSFVFTPSERIKQQMQVNSKYQNCWNVVQRIIETGGLRSLYTGWGAVLCRNIPHSIIKFYTYESLKRMLMSSQPPNQQPSTLQTLLCGGLAGSTAALFSTPFDVVKTRLQTQVPGSMQRYHSIVGALRNIHEHEGARGLYRGLIPRLAMYMSQGALFFASYEFLKGLLSLELRKSEMLKHKEDGKDDPLLSL